jgi:hypothetical protein
MQYCPFQTHQLRHTARFVYAWGGYLVFTDHYAPEECAPGRFPVREVAIRCSTHAYEGRFSAESNDAPVYRTCYVGERVGAWEVASLKREFDPGRGIVTQRCWSANKLRPGRQWFVKFWVPIPLVLFRARESRMFRLEAEAVLRDGRTVGSNVHFDDVSHLRMAC